LNRLHETDPGVCAAPARLHIRTSHRRGNAGGLPQPIRTTARCNKAAPEAGGPEPARHLPPGWP